MVLHKSDVIRFVKVLGNLVLAQIDISLICSETFVFYHSMTKMDNNQPRSCVIQEIVS